MKWDCKSGGDLDRRKIHSIFPHQSHTPLSEESETSQWEKMRKLDRKVKPGKKITFYYEKTREVKEKIRNESRHFPFSNPTLSQSPWWSLTFIFLLFSHSQLASAVCLSDHSHILTLTFISFLGITLSLHINKGCQCRKLTIDVTQESYAQMFITFQFLVEPSPSLSIPKENSLSNSSVTQDWCKLLRSMSNSSNVIFVHIITLGPTFLEHDEEGKRDFLFMSCSSSSYPSVRSAYCCKNIMQLSFPFPVWTGLDISSSRSICCFILFPSTPLPFLLSLSFYLRVWSLEPFHLLHVAGQKTWMAGGETERRNIVCHHFVTRQSLGCRNLPLSTTTRTNVCCFLLHAPGRVQSNVCLPFPLSPSS